MTQDPTSHPIPAPCIIDFGIIVNKEDIRRLLNDLGQIRYIHTLDGQLQSEGEGWIVEVFNDPQQATIVANQSLYINVQSFDYLQLHQAETRETYFDLIQDHRRLRLIPLARSLQAQAVSHDLDAATLEEMVTQVLAAKWDVQLDDDEDDCPF